MNTMTLRSKHERGALPIGIIIGVAIVGALVFVGIQLIPLYWGYLTFKDDAESSAKLVFVRYQRDHEKSLRGEITGGLKKIGAVYEEKNLIVKVDDKKKTASVEVWYTISHKVPFIENPMQFDVNVDTLSAVQ